MKNEGRESSIPLKGIFKKFFEEPTFWMKIKTQKKIVSKMADMIAKLPFLKQN